MPIDYELLRIIWWALIGLLLIGFAIMDGFDLGVAMWLPLLTKTDLEKRILINSIAPTWEGNQVWFILSGGAIFAAWPMLYAVSFSGFYMAMLFILLALILRPVGFKYRSKVESPRWRKGWDSALFIGGFVPALFFGVAIGNVLQGVPFHFDVNLHPMYTGDFLSLLNPFAMLTGLLSVTMLAMHGAYYLAVKTEGHVQKRAIKAGKINAIITVFLFILGGIWIYAGFEGYSLVQAMDYNGPSNPLYKEAAKQTGAWLNNYKQYPWLALVPTLGIFAALVSIGIRKRFWLAFFCSALTVGSIIMTVGISMFPFILPSSSMPAHSLMVWDSSSSQLTLFIMLGVTLVILPIVLLYTAWAYKKLSGKITTDTILANPDSAY